MQQHVYIKNGLAYWASKNRIYRKLRTHARELGHGRVIQKFWREFIWRTGNFHRHPAIMSNLWSNSRFYLWWGNEKALYLHMLIATDFSILFGLKIDTFENRFFKTNSSIEDLKHWKKTFQKSQNLLTWKRKCNQKYSKEVINQILGHNVHPV